MRALTWHGTRAVRVETVPDPALQAADDVIVQVTTTGLCGSDLQVQLRMGQANVHRWAGDILPLLGDDDPLGTEDFPTHHLPLESAPKAYEMFQEKSDGAVKVLFRPGT